MWQTTDRCEGWRDWLWPGLVSIAITVFFSIVAAGARFHVLGWPLVSGDMVGHLGAEYDNIAQSIYSGEGFCDPFGRRDGPTAWMPPVLPYFLASIYWLTDGNRSDVIAIATTLQSCCVAITLCLLLVPFRRHRRRWIIAGATAFAVMTHFHYLFQITHDHAPLLLAVTLWWYFFSTRWNKRGSRFEAIATGIAGGLTALASPVLGAVWAIVTCVRWRRSPSWVITAAILSILTVTPWMIRCKIVMGHWMPIKSNTAYELWQAHIIDDDGIFDMKTTRTHPYGKKNEDAIRYSTIGEMDFLDEKSAEWKSWLAMNQTEYLSRTTNRALAVSVDASIFHKSQWSRIHSVAAKKAWYIVSFLAMLTTLIFFRVAPIPLRLAASFWFLFLMPYVLISYYERYDIPVFGMKLFAVLSLISIGDDQIDSEQSEELPVLDLNARRTLETRGSLSSQLREELFGTKE